jgi:hypothetical protein
MRARLLLAVAVVAAAGCNSWKTVPVSGKVTLNGQPLANASVSFQPIAPEGKVEAGPGSQGKTNDKGEFTLTMSTGERGAMVGKHRVMISKLNTQVGDSDERAPRGGWPQGDEVPERYNAATELKFDVPSGGTNKADFQLTSP